MHIRNLNLHFGSKHVLKNIWLDIPANAVVALIGPSGCGKSTLLRCLNRMHDLHPDVHIQGEIVLDGHNILHGNTNPVGVRRKVGMVFQKPNPFPRSVFDNVAYGLEINGMKDRGQIAARVKKSLHGSYLWDEVENELDRSALDLSGGNNNACASRAPSLWSRR